MHNPTLEYGPEEVPAYAFCESVAAGSASPWHIRKVTQEVGLKLGGGIDTPSLCQHVKRGWDLRVRIREAHLDHTCRDCASLFREQCRANEIVIPA
jgi:hypothetical protein